MQTRTICGREVLAIGLGCMPMSTRRDRDGARSLATIHAALDAGVRVLDTADAYALDEAEFGHNEELIARALAGRDDAREVLLATKGGHVRRGRAWELDGRPEHLVAACEASLRRLRVEAIDLYQYHRPDPEVPFAETVGALRDLRDAGKVRHVGLSNVTVAQVEQALAIVEVEAVQNELSFRYLDPLRNGEVEACTRRRIAFLPWSPLGGVGNAGDVRVAAVLEIARRRGVSPQQVTLAWLLSLSPQMLPIPGASRPESIADSGQAAELELTADELAAIAAAE
jgi:aryl-alcohol dehydrogenase-like predicted oxidoreductase